MQFAQGGVTSFKTCSNTLGQTLALSPLHSSAVISLYRINLNSFGARDSFHARVNDKWMPSRANNYKWFPSSANNDKWMPSRANNDKWMPSSANRLSRNLTIKTGSLKMPLIEEILKINLFLVNLYSYHIHLWDTGSENISINWITEKSLTKERASSVSMHVWILLNLRQELQKFYRHKALSINDVITQGGGAQP